MLEGGDEGQPQRLAVGRRAAGSAAGSTTWPSATGSTQVVSGRGAPTGVSAVPTSPRSTGRARRFRPSIWSRQTLVAIRKSHDFIAAGSTSVSARFQARTIVSWVASSASNPDPSIR